MHTKRDFVRSAAGALVVGALETTAVAAPVDRIVSGARWLDDRGLPIQAHGGGISRWKGRFYWVGEDRSPGIPAGVRAIAAYSSKNFTNWRFERRVLSLRNPDGLGDNFVLERPKLYYNPKTRKHVMYFHLDQSRRADGGGGYHYARVGVAVSDRIDGEYRYAAVSAR